jgi:hypothetical protein
MLGQARDADVQKAAKEQAEKKCRKLKGKQQKHLL